MKVVIATGGSGGHIFPALRVAFCLKEEGHEVILIGALSRAEEMLRSHGLECFSVGSKGLATGSFGRLVDSCFAMSRAVGQSFLLLKKIRPEAVCGFGGYGAFPVVAAAKWLRIPAMIHEQNVIPGRANQWLGKIVAKVAVSFQESRKFFASKKVVVTGCPCHAVRKKISIFEARRQLGLHGDKTTVLVLGGSQGSVRLNQAFIQALAEWNGSQALQVIHLSGPKDKDALKEKYGALHVPCAVFDFLSEVGIAYQAANVVVARAGAVTVNEIAMFGLPSVLIPYPGAGGHQKENALILSRAGVAHMIEEKDLTPPRLAAAVLKWMQAPLSFEQIAEKVRKFYIPDAAERISREILSMKVRA